jgi:hypothetical protein
MSLPIRVVDRLFERLALTYGQQWFALWGGADVNAVKSLWGSELAQWDGQLEVFQWALDHLPERAPNLVQFKNLCREAPRKEAPALPLPVIDPARVQQAMQGLKSATTGGPVALEKSFRSPAQKVVDGLISRCGSDGLNAAQVSVLRAAVAALRNADPRRQDAVVQRYAPPVAQEVST